MLYISTLIPKFENQECIEIEWGWKRKTNKLNLKRVFPQISITILLHDELLTQN